MSVFLNQRSVFDGPPLIPSDIKGALRFELETNSYYKRLKNLSLFSLEIIGSLLLIGLLWITVDWVKIIVTSFAIGISLLLLFLVNNIL